MVLETILILGLAALAGRACGNQINRKKVEARVEKIENSWKFKSTPRYDMLFNGDKYGTHLTFDSGKSNLHADRHENPKRGILGAFFNIAEGDEARQEWKKICNMSNSQKDDYLESINFIPVHKPKQISRGKFVTPTSHTYASPKYELPKSDLWENIEKRRKSSEAIVKLIGGSVSILGNYVPAHVNEVPYRPTEVKIDPITPTLGDEALKAFLTSKPTPLIHDDEDAGKTLYIFQKAQNESLRDDSYKRGADYIKESIAKTDGQAEQKLIKLNLPPIGKYHEVGGTGLIAYSPGEIGALRGDFNMIGGR